MSDKTAEQKLWFDYISKLNDRTLSKKRASGLTIWAIGGLLIFLLFQIIDYLPKLIQDRLNFIDHIVVVTTIINITIYSIIFYLSILNTFSFEINQELKLKSISMRNFEPAIAVPLLFIGSLVVFLNFYCATTATILHNNFSIWPFWAIGSIIGIEIINTIVRYLSTYLKNRDIFEELPQVSTRFNNSQKRIIKEFFPIIVLFLLIISLVPTFFILPAIKTDVDIQKIKWSLEISGFLLCIIILFFRLAETIKNQYLLRLEQKIVLEDLPSESIKILFIKELLGENIKDFIRKNEDQLNQLSTQFNTKADEAEIDLAELDSIDKNMKYEIQCRAKKTYSNFISSFNNFLKKSNKIIKHIKYLILNNASSDYEIYFENFVSELEKQHDKIDQRYKDINKKYEDIINNIASSDIEKESIKYID